MKKLFFCLVFMILLCGLGGYLLLNFFQNKGSNTDNTSLNNNSVQSTLYVDNAGVSIKPVGATTYTTVNANESQIATGTYVKTDSSGSANVAFPDNSIVSLDPNTEIQINFSDSGINIFQLIGSTIHRVESVLQGKTYEVQTSNVNAVVRGTEFCVKVDTAQESKVYVMEHSVDVSQYFIKNGIKQIVNNQKIDTGKMVAATTPSDDTSSEGSKFEMTKIPDGFMEEHNMVEKMDRMDQLRRRLELDPTKVDASPTITILGATPTVTKVTTNPDFEQTISQALSRYTAALEGSEVCSLYKGMTAEEILSSLESIEVAYKVSPRVRSDFTKVVYAMSSACKDGVITKEEAKQIATLIPEKQ